MAGSLALTSITAVSPVDITAAGTTDWIRFATAPQRKSGGGSLISAVSGSYGEYNNDLNSISWTGGTPTATGNDFVGLFTTAATAISFTAPAGLTSQRLRIYTGRYVATARITVSLSDSSASPVSLDTSASAGQGDSDFECIFNAAAAGQTLTVSIIMIAGSGNVTLRGAALSPAAAAAPTGTLASTLGNATLAASGIALNAGAFASTLGNATMASSGSVGTAPSGTMVSTLADATMSAAGAATNAGSFATSLAGASMSAAGIVINRGTFSATMGDATMTAAGTVAPNATGTFSSTLDGATMTAYGYNGVPPVLAGFFHRLPKNPRHVQRIP